MTAVLLRSRKVGSTGLVGLSRGNAFRVEGIVEGDRLCAEFFPEGDGLSIVEDGIFPLPPEADFVRLAHVELGNRISGGVNVDLVRN